ncbi:NAD-dependent aldehyde dehydrogenase [Frankia torreyi]|uniref:NAD-dependent aldehyde dehydrogenase n=1 Tax=Frankia torreyi TaxID=1856 RepID=A0A0D8BIV7_9ACTN|nr:MULTISPECIES: aldehyde dehydrogenase family protein [Frankia]KJE23322.1 NAD-dependent aldehyde dehydrogenase [Frankia torreyi]KQC36446.1 aldehyde dehydrogenase [Frankia sp. ACN1ag]KQM05361.1 NAD-dependent aldehyde dehydrogenase [Frankia sp. CpI1-P]
MTTTNDRPVLVAGAWDAGAHGAWIPVLDPADLRHIVARVPALDGADIARTYDAAEAGARAWRAAGALERGTVLLRAAGLLRDRAADIAHDLVLEMGKTLAEATGEVAKAADFFEYYGSLARAPHGYELPDGRPDTSTAVRYEPVGIVLAITPWNDPLLTPARKLAPALSAGNAVVLKPATDTPLVSLHLAHALLDAGLPANALSVVTGRGRDISGPLLADRRLAAVTFTGSNEVGLAIMRTVAGRNLRVQTEMGGKNATAVLADADLDLAADTIAAAAFAQAGQRCTATSRLVVDGAVRDDLLAALGRRVAALRLGPGLEADTTMGPVVNTAQRDSVLDHVRQARAEGATLLAGGGTPADTGLSHGCFVEPTILGDVTPAMSIWRDEVFGPVLAVRTVDGFDEAVDAVNDSVYGLSAALFTRDLSAAHLFLDRADAGQVAVNLPTSGWDVHHPFGGFRESGSPFKEQGLEALHFYRRAKTTAIRFRG